VELPGTGVETSALGYGCSQLMTRSGRRDAARLLEAAFEAGITHFDAARAYGYGEAEGALGEFVRGRRDQVTVTTKLGLEPPRRSRGLDLAKSAARSAVAVVPPLRSLARRGAGAMMRRGHFAVAEARASLETSLRELGTDGVDLLLLHVVEPADLSDELLEFLRGCVESGRARAFGTATGPEESAAILAARPEFAPVVQVENSIGYRTAERFPELWSRGVITHSALACRGDAGAERALRWAIDANPDGVVLFSSSNPEHIRANVALG
jgi:aryl-alcohol dehydrogenase-like predicted oxidoreductase